MVPQVIHQTWKVNEITFWIFKRSQASIRTHLGHWQYRFWTDDDLDSFIRECYSAYHERWKALNKPIKKVDVARYFILHRFGGVYADLDFVFTDCIDSLFKDESDLYFYQSTQARVKKWSFLGNAWMAATPGKEFWLEAVDFMLALPVNTPVLRHTGPLALGAFYDSLLSRQADVGCIRILDPDIFDNERCGDGVGERRYGYHIRAATWQRQ